MDRYDEGKHVNSTRQEDDVPSTSMDRDVRVVRIDEEIRSMDPADRIAPMDRDREMSSPREVVRDRDGSDDVDDSPKRAGDILGLGGAVVPKSADDPSTEYDAESVAHRRARNAVLSDEPAGTGDITRTKGATGIDMGSGGEGTDLE
jgi:hypothetical protein